MSRSNSPIGDTTTTVNDLSDSDTDTWLDSDTSITSYDVESDSDTSFSNSDLDSNSESDQSENWLDEFMSWDASLDEDSELPIPSVVSPPRSLCP